MKKSTKIWLIIASALTVLGLLVSTAALAIAGFDFRILSQHKTKISTFEIDEDFENISIKADTADITFLPSENEKTKVVICEREDYAPSASVDDSTLKISSRGELKWYQHISIFDLSDRKITVYLPRTHYASLTIDSDTGDVDIPKTFSFGSLNIDLSTGDVKCRASVENALKIKTSTGDITVNGTSAGSLDLTVSTGQITASSVDVENDIKIKVSTGKTELSDITAKNLSTSGNTGDIKLKNVIISEKLSISRSTGDVTLDRCDASEIKIVTDTGEVNGSLLSEKVFFVKSDTGDIRVPQTMNGGKCDITTDTGDINITIAK